jgi:intracellular sulfur oxidation DsrE/DsrF family protein
MAKYTLIASRDLLDSQEAQRACDLAMDLKKGGNDVTVFLVQNAVLAARKGAGSQTYTKLSKGGVTVMADAFSLRERSIPADRLADGVRSADIDVVVDHLAEGRKVLWH